ncbi:MAG: ATP-binding protein [Bacteroidota bacterium]
MKIKRYIDNQLFKDFKSNKVIVLLGSRRVGKTFLVQQLLAKYKGKKLLLNGEDADVQETFRKRSIANFKRLVGSTQLLVIDEAQAIPQIGAALKLIIDSHPRLTILATGSSALDLLNKTGEPLTGRSFTYLLYPIAQLELNENSIQAKSNLEERLILGSYPELFQLKTSKEKQRYLKELTQSYLLKDILAYTGIRQAGKLTDLLRLIAYQIGSEVSYHELSRSLGINKITVEHYLDLLQKVYILFKLPSYSTNQRNELSKGAKWYFFDNGIRNAIIQDFRAPGLRNDLGALWENYIIAERFKRNSYLQENRQLFFWRTYQQQEIDLIESENGIINAFEIKYNQKNKSKPPLAFTARYPTTPFLTINPDNYLEFICTNN